MDRGLLRGVVNGVVFCEVVCVKMWSEVLWVLIYPVCCMLVLYGVVFGESCMVWDEWLGF